ncbi:MAG TPA: DUF4136 domain-containing protein [Gammaproteobacteria bacterium]|nr:DUF4136 domain-containing protein [Gammaproteobacteria bacterium]
MNRLIGIALLLIAAPVAAQKVTIDYAKDIDFNSVKTFQYVPSEDGAPDPLMAERIDALIKQKLVDGGLKEVTENPDIFVTYHLTAQQNQVLNTTGFGYGGYGPGWGAWGGAGLSTATTTVSTYTEGTLIVDAYRASDKKLVWRGTGTDTVSGKPEKRTKQVESVLNKLGDRWQRILKNEGK